MAKFRESAYVNDFVMFRNACEERKLKSTLSYIDRMKTHYHKQQDKEKLFFAVQHLSVPARRSHHVRHSTQDVTKRSVSAPTSNPNVSTPSKKRLPRKCVSSKPLGNTNPGKLLQKRENCQKTFQTEVLNDDDSLHPPNKPSEHASTNDSKLIAIEQRQSARSERSQLSADVKIERTCEERLKLLLENSKYGETSSRVDKEIQVKTPLTIFYPPKANNSSLPSLPSKKEWEQKLHQLKPTNKVLSRREQQEVAEDARNKWREAFENMKKRRLSLYQSKISSTTADKETTFVKFLPKNQQAFYIKDVQFAQKFL